MSSRPLPAPHLPLKGSADPAGEDFPFAAWLDRGDLICLGRHVTWHTFRAGDFLWREGECDDRLALVVRGKVRLLKGGSFPGRSVVLGVFGPGALVADLAFTGEGIRDTSAQAAQELEAVFLSREGFEALAAEHPEVAHRLLAEVLGCVADQLRHAYRRITSLF